MSRSLVVAASSMLLPLSVVCAINPVHAQQDRPFMTGTQQAPMPDEPSFRDPKTGQVWTPDNVGQDSKPVDTNPDDRAFNPSGQVVNPGPITEQQAMIRRIGTVPITAGPSVPLVEIDNPSLRVGDGRRWHVVIYLQNNSANVYQPILGCRFFNGENTVMDTRVLVPTTPGGERIGVSFDGPPAQVYTDRIGCRVITP